MAICLAVAGLSLVAALTVGKTIGLGRAAETAAVTVRPTGDDATCSRGGSACRSWQRAINVAHEGDVIAVAGGTYPGETLTGSKSVTFRVSSGQTASFSGGLQLDALSNVKFYGPIVLRTSDPYVDLKMECSANLAFHDVSGRVFFVYNGSRNISLYGGDWGGYTAAQGNGFGDSALSGYNQSGSSGCGDGWVRNVLIDGIRFHDVYYGSHDTWNGAHPDCLESYGKVDGITVRDSTFERCGNTFIGFYTDFGDNRNMLVENNRFSDVADSFWTTQIGNKGGYTCDLVFRYNTYDTRIAGVNAPPLLGCPNQQVYGNIFAKGPPTDGGLGCSGSWSYNVFESTASGGNCGTNARVVRDAFFVERGKNYHLRAGSPAIGRGDPKRFPQTDVDGARRPADREPDAGFDEAAGLIPNSTRELMADARDQLATAAAAAAVSGSATCLGRTSASDRLESALGSLTNGIAVGNGGAARDLCALITSAVSGWTHIPAARLGGLASEPRDPRFRSIALPKTGRALVLRGATAKTKPIAAAFNAESENIAVVSALLAAYVTSIGRAQAAGNAGDAGWQDKQLDAAHGYARQASVALSKEATLRLRLARALRNAGLPGNGLSAAEARTIAAARGGNLSAVIRRSLAALGLRPGEIRALTNRAKQLSGADLVGESLTRALAEPKTLRQLRVASTALRRLAGT
jgi:hypothetical protein